MENNSSVRWGWLKAMYVYTVFGAGGFGLAMLLIPFKAGSAFRRRIRSFSGFMEVSFWPQASSPSRPSARP